MSLHVLGLLLHAQISGRLHFGSICLSWAEPCRYFQFRVRICLLHRTCLIRRCTLFAQFLQVCGFWLTLPGKNCVFRSLGSHADAMFLLQLSDIQLPLVVLQMCSPQYGGDPSYRLNLPAAVDMVYCWDVRARRWIESQVESRSDWRGACPLVFHYLQLVRRLPKKFEWPTSYTNVNRNSVYLLLFSDYSSLTAPKFSYSLASSNVHPSPTMVS